MNEHSPLRTLLRKKIRTCECSFMEIKLYLIKLENWKKENRLTKDYVIQYTTKNVKVTSFPKV